MTELLSYDEDAREAVISVRHIASEPRRLRAGALNHLSDTRDPYAVPWPIDGDELTKRGMK